MLINQYLSINVLASMASALAPNGLLALKQEQHSMNVSNLIPKRKFAHGTKPEITNEWLLAPEADEENHWIFS